jgi:hypothetical protein
VRLLQHFPLVAQSIGISAILCLAGACTSAPPTEAPTIELSAEASVTLDATVRDHRDISPGCMSLQTSQGTYQPLDLPKAYAREGMQVRVRLRAAPEMMSICMLGQLVHVESIGRRN